MFAFAGGNARPWLGALKIDDEYTPMSWLENGNYYNEENYSKAQDIPSLEEKAHQLRSF